MSIFGNDEERAREWPIESLSAWAAAVVDQVERAGGDGESAYCSMFELADTLGLWEGKSTHEPGQVWTAANLRSIRRRYAHLLERMLESRDLVPEHPVWITLQVVDFLDTHDGLPVLTRSEVERRTRYLKLLGTAERMTRTQFDLAIAAAGDGDRLDSRRPETADESVSELVGAEDVRARTLPEIADDLREEAARAYLPEQAMNKLSAAAAAARRGKAEEASIILEQLVEFLYDVITDLGDFRTRLVD